MNRRKQGKVEQGGNEAYGREGGQGKQGMDCGTGVITPTLRHVFEITRAVRLEPDVHSPLVGDQGHGSD